MSKRSLKFHRKSDVSLLNRLFFFLKILVSLDRLPYFKNVKFHVYFTRLLAPFTEQIEIKIRGARFDNCRTTALPFLKLDYSWREGASPRLIFQEERRSEEAGSARISVETNRACLRG